MRSFTAASLFALLAAGVAGAPVDTVDTLRSYPGVTSLDSHDSVATESSGPDVPYMSKLKVAGKYYMAMGEEYTADTRAAASQYVSGIEYMGTGTLFDVRRHASPDGPQTYIMFVEFNLLSSKPSNWYLTAQRLYDSDSFGDKQHSLRVIAHRDPAKKGLWRFIENPSSPGTMLMVLHESMGKTAADVRDWYLAMSDSPDAVRDCVSVYLTVTDDQEKAATVEFVSDDEEQAATAEFVS